MVYLRIDFTLFLVYYITMERKQQQNKQEETNMRKWNEVLNKYGYEVEGAAWCKDCYDIYKMDESCIPVYADCTEEFVEEFIKKIIV